jgi:anti-sigma B factor antagonist
MLRVAVQPDPEGTCILQVVGEIDLVTAPLLRSSAMEVLERPHRRLVLDLQQVAFLASSGLAVLVDIRTEALRRGVGLQLVTTSRAVLRPLIATGLIQLFEVDASGTEPI